MRKMTTKDDNNTHCMSTEPIDGTFSPTRCTWGLGTRRNLDLLRRWYQSEPYASVSEPKLANIRALCQCTYAMESRVPAPAPTPGEGPPHRTNDLCVVQRRTSSMATWMECPSLSMFLWNMSPRLCGVGGGRTFGRIDSRAQSPIPLPDPTLERSMAIPRLRWRQRNVLQSKHRRRQLQCPTSS